MFRSKFSYSDSKSSYSDLLEDIETGKIESIFFYPRQREIDVLYKNGDKFKIPILYNDQLILEKATENKVDLTINNSRKEASAANSFASISLFLIFILAIVLILRSTSKLASRAFGFSKNQSKFLIENDNINLQFYEGSVVGLELPDNIILKVEETEAVVKGQTAASSYKPAILTRGIKTSVPPFISTEDYIVISTANASYVEKVKK